MAVCSQELLRLCSRHITSHRRCPRHGDEEAGFHHKDGSSTGRILGVICAKLPVSTSDVSSTSSVKDLGQQTDREDAVGPVQGLEGRDTPSPAEKSERPLHGRAAVWALNHPLLICSSFFTLIICIPVRYSIGLEEPLGVSLLLALWSTTQTLQASIRTSTLALPRLLQPKLRIALSVTCNPVLWTAIGLISYAAAESHRSHRPVGAVLSTLERNTTFTDLVMHRSSHPDGSSAYIDFRVPISDASATHSAIAAGDVANAILSAGLVCWGLKLWEYRRRLLSSAGFTILLVSCATALANVVLGPLLAKGVLGQHSRPGYDMAFVARTVTLALGAPAVERIGGDVGLNAAMVVVNGIVCQMALGLGVGKWLGRVMGRVEGRVGEFRRRAGVCWRRADGEGSPVEKEAEVVDGKAGNGVLPPSTAAPPDGLAHPDHDRHSPPHSPATITTTTTIAAGITIGINAAAMGTAHLYEAGSVAAPYSALAMTVFGVATVGLTMIPQLGGWIAARVQ